MWRSVQIYVFLSMCVSALFSKHGLRGGFGGGRVGIWVGLGRGDHSPGVDLWLYISRSRITCFCPNVGMRG